MPKRKSTDDAALSPDSSTHTAPVKRSKKTAQPTFSSGSKSTRDEEGNVYWEISRARRVTISEYNKKKMVSVREYYEKDGKWLPGKKGISMTLEQYWAFVELLPEIERELVRGGEDVRRPRYADGVDDQRVDDEDEDEDENDEGDSEDDDRTEADARRNFEATSDEDE